MKTGFVFNFNYGHFWQDCSDARDREEIPLNYGEYSDHGGLYFINEIISSRDDCIIYVERIKIARAHHNYWRNKRFINEDICDVSQFYNKYGISGNPAQDRYIKSRMNGKEQDSPSRSFPCDGKTVWQVQVRPKDSNSEHNEQLRWFSRAFPVYLEGPDDKAWMEERDRNYVFRLDRKGRQNLVEPNLEQEVPELYAELQAIKSAARLERDAAEQQIRREGYEKIIKDLEENALEILNLDAITQDWTEKCSNARKSIRPDVGGQLEPDPNFINFQPEELNQICHALMQNSSVKSIDFNNSEYLLANRELIADLIIARPNLTIRPQSKELDRRVNAVLQQRQLLASLGVKPESPVIAEEQRRIQNQRAELAAEQERQRKQMEELAAERDRLRRDIEEQRKTMEELAILRELSLSEASSSRASSQAAVTSASSAATPSPSASASSQSPPQVEGTNLSASFLIPYNELSFGNQLGEGGYGIVYQGRWRNAEVAIKKIRITILSAEAEDEMRHEAEIMTQLHHPNIIQTYGVSLDNPGNYSLVMELMPMGSLYQLLHGGKELDWNIRYQIAMDITCGIEHLHSQNILHRDLKSLNILMTNDFRAKVTDFGLSKVRTETTTLSTMSGKGNPIGTCRWMEPDLLKIGERYEKASDIYSYGMILWELITREIPFSGAPNETVVLMWLMQGQYVTFPSPDQTECSTKYMLLAQDCWGPRDTRPTIEQAAIQLREVMAEHQASIPAP